MAVNIGIDDADFKPLVHQRRGKIYRHRGLADAALARSHRKDSRGGFWLGKRDFRLSLAATELLFQLSALLITHGFHRHGDVSYALNILYCCASIGLDGGLHGAAGDGEVNFYGYIVSGDRN